MTSKKLTKSHLKRLYGLLSPACSGKTTLFRELKKCHIRSKTGTQYLTLDIDEVTFKDDNPIGVDEKLPSKEQTFPKRRDAIKTVLEDFTKYKVIVFTSDPELLKYLGLDTSHIKVFVHSQELFLSYISPLLNFTHLEQSDDKDDKDSKDSKDGDKSEALTPDKRPIHVFGVIGQNSPTNNSSYASPSGVSRTIGRTGSTLSVGDANIDPAESIPARLVSHIESLTKHTVTIDGVNGSEVAEISFKTETINICKSRDDIMGNHNYQIYQSITEFKQLVADAFKLVVTIK